MPDAYAELLRLYRETALLESCIAALGWDELTCMPPGAVGARAEQLAYLSGLQHEKATNPRIGELLDALTDFGEPYSPAAVNVREIRRAYHRLTRLPRALVEELARVAPLAQQQWATSRQEADFATFRPWLEKLVQLKRQEAECLGHDGDPYDALLEDYEPGCRSRDLAPLFAGLRDELAPLLQAIGQSKKRSKVAILRRHYPLEQQRAFAQEVAVALGFDFERGRLDTAVHPFSMHVATGDCRIAIRYTPHYFPDGFYALLHEAGHGLYEQGLDLAHEYTPMGSANSLAVHESQARLWENLVGRGLPFWKHFYKRARQAFPEALGRVPLGDFFTAINHVEPTLNRVQADEVTYNLHILIRFELERAMIRGDLPLADLPAAWGEVYGKYLGVKPANDAEGCLQDGHWGEGLFGYFPTYTLGNIYAAQLMSAAGTFDTAFARGDFGGLLDWLRTKVHREGSRYSAPKLIEHATGSLPDVTPLITGLRRKYGEVYDL